MPVSRLPARHRQLLQRAFFLAAIIAPSVLLVTLSLRLIGQDSELAEKRAQDSRRLAAAEIAQRLSTRLERLRLQAPAGGSVWNPGAEAIALVASVEGEQLILPWEDTGAQARFRSEVAAPQFASAIADGERRQFVSGDRSAAHAAYRAALTAACSPEQRAAATLALLRIATAGAEADRAASFLLQSAVVDEEGVPLSLYAARVVLARGTPSRVTVGEVIEAVRRALNRVPPVNLVALHMIHALSHVPELGRGDVSGAASTLRSDVALRLAAAERAYELHAAFAGLAARQDSVGPTWLPFGPDDDLWLVTITRTPMTQEPTVVAVRPGVAVDADIQLGRRRGERSEPLGAGYPGLFARVPVQPATDHESVRTVMMGVVILTLAIALSGGWFFWRDVQRDLRLAELRSQFVASVSNELKTPLTAIRMFVETMRLVKALPSARGRTPIPCAADRAGRRAGCGRAAGGHTDRPRNAA